MSEDGFLTASFGRKPQRVTWIAHNDRKSLEANQTNLSVFTETHFNPFTIIRDEASIKVGWITESRAIRPFGYLASILALPFLDLILTNDRRLLRWSRKYSLVHVGSSRASEHDIYAEHKKQHLVSIIASSKRSTAGHKFRHRVIKKFGSKLDLWGSGYKTFRDKREALGPYRYSVAIMNANYASYFTEILIDCFVFKTIPIFWGDPTVMNEFDSRGMYVFRNMDELEIILSRINPQDYEERLPYVEENYKTAVSKFLSTDDIVADKLLALTRLHTER